LDNFKRTFFTEMPGMDICKTLTVGKIVFMAGTEALEFKNGQAYIADTMSEQIKTVVRKMDETLKEIGLSLEAMVKHTIYLTKGSAEPIDVIREFHDECYKRAPGLKKRPSTGTLCVVEALTAKTFKIEVDAIAAYPD
jgi:enamine deaminase RidA (YjgF/YER057c/UK114 family)